jgi:hypothetical protein
MKKGLRFVRLSTTKWLPVTLILFCTISCQKEKIQNIEEQTFSSAARTNSNRFYSTRVEVSNIDELYAAVNNANHEGALIMISPGTYVLNANYPNGGRIELQKNMTLQGQPGHAESVIIDASQLPGSSFIPSLNFPAPRTGAIRMGKGNNSMEWLTVKGNPASQALSAIDTDLIGDGECNITIAHCIVTGGRIGIDIRNVGLASKNRVIHTALMDNEILENLVQQGQGIEIQNANGASGAVIHAVLNGNYVHGNKVGLRSFNNNANNTRTDSGSIIIQSNADRFEENGIGIFLAASLNQGASTSANMNTLSFEAHGSGIQNNKGTIPSDVPDAAPGGLYVAGGLSANSGALSSNTLQVNLFGCTLSNNNGPDMKAYGYLSLPGILYGRHNVATIHLAGVSANSIVAAIASVPNESEGTNIINVYHNR